MTMTPERLAELDAVMAKVRAFPFGSEEWEVAFIPARLAAYNAYPDLRAHIDEQSATIARLREALANMANTINIVGSPYDGIQKAADELIHDVKKRARAALTGAAS